VWFTIPGRPDGQIRPIKVLAKNPSLQKDKRYWKGSSDASYGCKGGRGQPRNTRSPAREKPKVIVDDQDNYDAHCRKKGSEHV